MRFGKQIIAIGFAASSVSLSGHAFAESNKPSEQASIEDGGWTVAWGSEIDQVEEVACAAAIAAIGPGGAVACVEDAIQESVTALGWDVVVQALTHLGSTFGAGEFDVKADIATYNHWHVLFGVKIPEPNTYQPYVKWRRH
jgi:hypothetical protein